MAYSYSYIQGVIKWITWNFTVYISRKLSYIGRCFCTQWGQQCPRRPQPRTATGAVYVLYCICVYKITRWSDFIFQFVLKALLDWSRNYKLHGKQSHNIINKFTALTSDLKTFVAWCVAVWSAIFPCLQFVPFCDLTLVLWHKIDRNNEISRRCNLRANNREEEEDLFAKWITCQTKPNKY